MMCLKILNNSFKVMFQRDILYLNESCTYSNYITVDSCAIMATFLVFNKKESRHDASKRMKSLLPCSQWMMMIMMWEERLYSKMLSHIKAKELNLLKTLYFDTWVLFLDTCFTEVQLSTCTSSCRYIHL